MTDKVTTGEVVYGLTNGYGSGPVASTTPGTSHSVVLTGLDPDTLHHFQITATDTGNRTTTTPDDTFTTLPANGSGIVSDDFNDCLIDTNIWGFSDPIGDATFAANGTQLEIAVPAGTSHDAWNGLTVPRLTQPINNTDFEIEIKYDSFVTQTYQMQGVIISEDTSNYLRFDYFSANGNVHLFASREVNGTPTALVNITIPATSAPLFTRIGRTGNTWTYAYSLDGTTWTTAASFQHTLTTTELGLYAGNDGTTPPAHTTIVDYLFDTTTPITPEDPTTPTCP